MRGSCGVVFFSHNSQEITKNPIHDAGLVLGYFPGHSSFFGQLHYQINRLNNHAVELINMFNLLNILLHMCINRAIQVFKEDLKERKLQLVPEITGGKTELFEYQGHIILSTR